MTEAHIALPRPSPPLPQTDSNVPNTAYLPDLALAVAGYILEDAPPATLFDAVGLLSSAIAPDGTAPSLARLDSGGVVDRPGERFLAGMWAAWGVILAGATYTAGVGYALSAAQHLTSAPYLVQGDSVAVGDFIVGDGTRLGAQSVGSVYLLRETVLAGLVLHSAAAAFGDQTLYAAARQVLRVALARFRAPDGTLYAHAVTLDRVAGFGRDTEAEALLGLLCLRLRADQYADELLSSIEKYTAARLTPQGRATGYSQNGTIPNIGVRATLLAAAFQREAGRYGAARNTLRGLEPLRDNAGAVGGYGALSVGIDAALDHRYLAARAVQSGAEAN